MNLIPPIKSIARKEIHLDYIDGLRGIAILLVLIQHTVLSLPGRPTSSLVFELMDNGFIGVPLFFVISSFTLYRSCWFQDQKSFSWGKFYLRRFFRIMPLWWISVVLYSIARSVEPSLIPLNLFFIFGFIPDESIRIIGPGWSLFVEEIFYLSLPLLFVFIKSRKASLVGFIGAVIISYLYSKNLHLIYEPEVLKTFTPIINPLLHLPSFFLGFVLFHFMNKKSWERFHWSMYLLDLIAIISYCTLVRSGWRLLLVPVLFIFLSGVLKWSLIGRLVRTGFLRYLGKMCFSIYLLHDLVIDLSMPLRNKLFYLIGLSSQSTEVQFILWFPILILICVFFGSWSFKLIEENFILLGKQISKKLSL